MKKKFLNCVKKLQLKKEALATNGNLREHIAKHASQITDFNEILASMLFSKKIFNPYFSFYGQLSMLKG